jgi:GTPase
MIEIDPRGKMVRKALLVGAYDKPAGKSEAESLLAELAELVETLGVPICQHMLVHTREIHARYLIGTGKAEEISQLLKEEGLDSLIFDNELTPSQQRNWEKLTGVTVLDRQEVILDIFAQRAQTHEARFKLSWPAWNTLFLGSRELGGTWCGKGAELDPRVKGSPSWNRTRGGCA